MHASSSLTPRAVAGLHGGLILTNLIWSGLHILMAIPLRQGFDPKIMALYREVVGLLAISAVALPMERCGTLDRRPWKAASHGAWCASLLSA